MGNLYKYAVLKFGSHPVRGESLNVGIVVITDESIDVRLTRRLNKLHSISAALDLDAIRNSLLRIEEFDNIARDEGAESMEARLSRISQIAGIQFSNPSVFDAASIDGYEQSVARILKNLVDPEPAPRLIPRKRPTALKSSLLKTLKADNILAKKGEDLSSHRVVANYTIVEGIEADLMLKNGSMHVFETVDATSETLTARKIISDIAVATIVFEQAKMTFGEQQTSTKLIYQASVSAENAAAPALSAAEHQGAELVNWESQEARVKFLLQLNKLAEPFEDANDRAIRIHASAQHKFSIN